MNAKVKILVGVLTALAMMLLTFALPRGGMIRETAVVQFPHDSEDLGDFRAAVCEVEIAVLFGLATFETVYGETLPTHSFRFRPVGSSASMV